MNEEKIEAILREPVYCEDRNSHYIDESNRYYLASLIAALFEPEPDGKRDTKGCH